MADHQKSAKKRRSLATQVVVTQTNPSLMRQSLGGGVSNISSRYQMSSRMVNPSFNPAGVAAKSRVALTTIKDCQDKDKSDLSGLNTRLAGLMEAKLKTESLVNMLTEKVDRLMKEKFPPVDEVNAIYKEELEDCKGELTDLKERIAELEAKKLDLSEKLDSKDNENDMLRKEICDKEEKMRELGNKICDLEDEMNHLRMNADFDKENIAAKCKEIDRLKAELEASRADCYHARDEQLKLAAMLETESNDHDVEKAHDEKVKQCLQFEVEGLKRIQVQPKALETGFKEALREIQTSCDKALADRTQQLEAMYSSKLAALDAQPKHDVVDSVQIKENKTLKSKMSSANSTIASLEAQLRALQERYADLERESERQADDYEKEIAELKEELQRLKGELEETDFELSQTNINNSELRNQIIVYEKILNKETARMQNVLERTGNIQNKQAEMFSNIVGGSGSGSGSGSGGGSSSQSSTMSTVAGRVQIKKKNSSGGACQFKSIATDGTNLVLENSTATAFKLDGVSVEREGTKGKNFVYKFPDGCSIKPRSCLKVYGSAYEDEAKEECQKDGIEYIIMDQTKWGVSNSQFKVCKDSKEICWASINFS